MKQYKLIKEYPRSPKLNTVVTWADSDKFKTIYCCIDQTMILVEEIENYPEFWQKIITKNYEILSFRNKNKPYNVYTLEKDGKYHGISGSCIPYEYCIDHYAIHSVRRLSDNVTFTQGDRIKSTFDSHVKADIIVDFGQIYSDRYKCDDIFATFKDGLSLISFEHDTPLFRTSDNVPIFIGDKVWSVVPDILLLCSWDKVTIDHKNFTGITFSTEAAARNYIDLNKPQYTKQQILNLSSKFIPSGAACYSGNEIRNKITECLHTKD
jgi:hypothetical protein